jgi:large subunit ribosomal protein L28
MSRHCEITGKGPMSGNKVSHSNIKTRRRTLPNIQEQRFWVPSQNRFVRLKVSARGIKIINKIGIERALQKIAALQG